MDFQQMREDIERKGTEYRCGDLRELVDEVIESLSKKERNIARAERSEEDYSLLLAHKFSDKLGAFGVVDTLIEKYSDVLVEEVRVYSDDDYTATETASIAIEQKSSWRTRHEILLRLAQEYGFFLL